MSIEKTFDNLSEETIRPSMIYDRIEDEIENLPEVAVVTFLPSITEIIKNRPDVEKITDNLSTSSSDNDTNVYAVTHKNKRIAVYQTIVGGPISVSRLEAMIAWGVKKFVFFGCCGVLDKDIADGNLIVPTAAYRDEGTSYHYAEASDYIEVKTVDKLSDIMTGLKLPYVKGRTWTTDAFFRETRNNMQKRKDEGCLTVEMECASIMAAGQFRGVEVYQFLYAADNLDSAEWEIRSLGSEMPLTTNEKYLLIALDIASMI
jgi:uridine phosphorylase